MTKTKNTKRALLSSVLALVVCIAMLVGSTFAWFTDNATTSGNTIISGKLDVALEMEENGAWVNAEGKTLKWITEDQVSNVLWEPGCTYKLPKLRVVNKGNLALKYTVAITGLTGDVKLLEAIDFTGIPVEDEYVNLLPEEEKVFQIEGHMKEDAGNEYMDLELTGITITVNATQLNYENDSYGPDYDKLILSDALKLPATSAPVTLKTKDNAPVQVELPADVVDTLKDEGITEVSLVHTAMKQDTVNGQPAVTFDKVDLVDQNGNIIALEDINQDSFTVTLLTSNFNANDDVAVFHDGLFMASAQVSANGTISYSATHFCEVNVVSANGYTPVADGVWEDNGNYAILSADGLAWLEAQSDAAFSGKTVKLIADIDCTGKNIKPIRFWDPERPTTFDGQGFTVKNLTIDNSGAGNQALINGTVNIKNLNVDGAKINGYGYVAVIAGTVYGNIDNCTVKNAEVTGGYWQVGVIAAQYNSGSITNCTVEGCKVTGPSAVGLFAGIFNENSGTRKFENCKAINCEIVQNYGFGGDYDLMYGVITGCVNTNGATVHFNNCTIDNVILKGAASTTLYGVVSDSNTVYIDGVKQ